MIAMRPLKMAMRLCYYNSPTHFYLVFVLRLTLSVPLALCLCLFIYHSFCIWTKICQFWRENPLSDVELKCNVRDMDVLCMYVYFWINFVCRKFSDCVDDFTLNIGHRPQILTTLWFTRSFTLYLCTRVCVCVCILCASHLHCFHLNEILLAVRWIYLYYIT